MKRCTRTRNAPNNAAMSSVENTISSGESSIAGPTAACSKITLPK